MRELIWAVIAILAGYVVLQLYRAMRVESRQPSDDNEEGEFGSGSSHAADPSATGKDDDPGNDDVFVFEPAVRTVPPDAGVDFHATLQARQMHQVIERLDEKLAAQQARIAELESALGTLREQLDTTGVVQNISPEYNEALVFARRGLDVDAIAERCGISVAEAELVRSLAQQGSADTGEDS